MNYIETNYRPATRTKAALRVLFFALMIVTTLSYQATYASTLKLSAVRVSVAGDKFSDTWQSAAVFDLPAPRRLRARRLEFATGVFATSSEAKPFVSLGPVWRLPLRARRTFVEVGISPTLIFGSNFNGRDLGGNFHFTSSATIGTTLGESEASTLSLRIQHTSNAGLSSPNPGMDMIGVNFAFGFDR